MKPQFWRLLFHASHIRGKQAIKVTIRYNLCQPSIGKYETKKLVPLDMIDELNFPHLFSPLLNAITVRKKLESTFFPLRTNWYIFPEEKKKFQKNPKNIGEKSEKS